jgi:hypothetical protein
MTFLLQEEVGIACFANDVVNFDAFVERICNQRALLHDFAAFLQDGQVFIVQVDFNIDEDALDAGPAVVVFGLGGIGPASERLDHCAAVGELLGKGIAKTVERCKAEKPAGHAAAVRFRHAGKIEGEPGKGHKVGREDVPVITFLAVLDYAPAATGYCLVFLYYLIYTHFLFPGIEFQRMPFI